LEFRRVLFRSSFFLPILVLSIRQTDYVRVYAHSVLNKKLMKKGFLLITILGLAFNSHAQLLKKIQRKVEDRVEKSVDGILNGQDKENTSSRSEEHTS